MKDIFITSVGLFFIGITVGFSLQCFFICASLLAPHISAQSRNWQEATSDTPLFLGGQPFAYTLF